MRRRKRVGTITDVPYVDPEVEVYTIPEIETVPEHMPVPLEPAVPLPHEPALPEPQRKDRNPKHA